MTSKFNNCSKMLDNPQSIYTQIEGVSSKGVRHHIIVFRAHGGGVRNITHNKHKYFINDPLYFDNVIILLRIKL